MLKNQFLKKKLGFVKAFAKQGPEGLVAQRGRSSKTAYFVTLPSSLTVYLLKRIVDHHSPRHTLVGKEESWTK